MALLTPTARLAFNAGLIAAAVFSIGTRMFVRYRYRSFPLTLPWVLSDVFVLIALAFSAAALGFDFWLTIRQLRGDLDIFTLLERTMQAMFLNQAVYFTTLWSVKASFLCSYFLRISGLSRSIRLLLRLSAALLLLSFIAVSVALLAWCRPLPRNWSLGNDFCSPLLSRAHTIFGYVMHMGTDLPILAIPFFILRSLRLERRERFGAGFLFFLGFCTVVVSTIQFVLYLKFIHMNEAGEANTDETVDRIYITSSVEILMSILAVCGPSLRVLLRKSVQGTQVTELTVRSTLRTADEKGAHTPATPMAQFNMGTITEEGSGGDEERGFAREAAATGESSPGGSTVSSVDSAEICGPEEIGQAR